MSLTYKQPTIYAIHPDSHGRGYISTGQMTPSSFYCHASRVMRFDGIRPTTVGSWDAYDQDWGTQRAGADDSADTAAHDNREWHGAHVAGGEHGRHVVGRLPRRYCGDYEELSDDPNHYMAEYSKFKSQYHAQIIDSEDKIERLSYNFAGLDKIAQMALEEIAAGADIPIPRFLGQSPAVWTPAAIAT